MLLLLSFVTFCVLCVWFGLRVYQIKQFYKPLDEIPGPTDRDLLRNVLFTTPEKIWLYYRNLGKQYYPIYKYWHTVYPVVNIFTPEDTEIVLSTMKHITKSVIYDSLQPWLGTGLLTSTGSKWQNRRKILTPAFHFNILQQFVATFNEQSQILVETLKSEYLKSHTNVVPIISKFTLHSICETAMGTQLEAEPKKLQVYIDAIYSIGDIIVQILSRPWLQVYLIYVLTPTFWKHKTLVNILHSFSTEIIGKRKQNFKTPDENNRKGRLALLDILIEAQNSGHGIDDIGIREEVDTFMFEGHDTTTACICFTLLMLANHTDVQEKVVEELNEIFDDSDRTPTFQDLQNMHYLEKVIKETLRLYPSVPFISRVAEEDIKTYSGYTVPKGTILQLHLYDLHRNSEIFPEPSKFDPERFSPENSKNRHPFAYIPFSAGPRNCIGQKFAFLEVKTVISSILRKFALHPIDTPEDIIIKVHLVLKSKDGIRIKFIERSQS